MRPAPGAETAGPPERNERQLLPGRPPSGLSSPGCSAWPALQDTGRALLKFAEVDLESFAFRFPMDKKGGRALPTDLTHSNLRHVRDVVDRLAGLLDAAVDQISVELDWKREMEAEYRPVGCQNSVPPANRQFSGRRPSLRTPHPLAAAETGGDAEAAQDELVPWLVPMLVTAAITFALGALGFALGIVRSGVLSPQLTWLVAGALVVMAAARFVPLGAAQIVIGVAGIVALWPLAYEMWNRPEAVRPGEEPRPVPTT